MEIRISDNEMDVMEKLAILTDAAKYDVACTSSGSKRKNTGDGLGNCVEAGICHSFSADGRCISLLKILFTKLSLIGKKKSTAMGLKRKRFLLLMV